MEVVKKDLQLFLQLLVKQDHGWNMETKQLFWQETLKPPYSVSINSMKTIDTLFVKHYNVVNLSSCTAVSTTDINFGLN